MGDDPRQRVCFVTTTRADWGLMRPLIVACRQNVRLDPLIVATGTHMHAYFGAIIDDDITPDGRTG